MGDLRGLMRVKEIGDTKTRAAGSGYAVGNMKDGFTMIVSRGSRSVAGNVKTLDKSTEKRYTFETFEEKQKRFQYKMIGKKIKKMINVCDNCAKNVFAVKIVRKPLNAEGQEKQKTLIVFSKKRQTFDKGPKTTKRRSNDLQAVFVSFYWVCESFPLPALISDALHEQFAISGEQFG